MTSSRLSLIVLAAALVVVFHRLLLGEVFFWGLPALQFVPWRDYAFDLLRQGQLPLWNPYDGAGAPLLANYQSALLYPLNWSGLALPLAWSMSVTAVLHLFIAGCGMWALTGRLGASALGRGLSALAFGMTAYLIARLGTYPIIEAAAWLGWLLWAAHGVMLGKPRSAAWLALFAALQLLAGHAQTTWYSFLLVGMYSTYLAISGVSTPNTTSDAPSPLRETEGRGVRLLSIALLLTLGAGVAAIQLAATGELLMTSQRSGGVTRDFALNFSYGPARILNLISPNAFGTPADGTYVESGYFFEYAVYIGLIPLISAIAAIIAWLRSRRASSPALYFVERGSGGEVSSVPFWVLVVLVGFVLALGRYTPVFPFLYDNVPTFDLFQAPVRWHLWTVCGLSVLAGLGASAWGRGFATKRWARRMFAASLGVVIVAVAASFMFGGIPGAALLIRAMLTTGILAVIACWLTLRQPEPLRITAQISNSTSLLVGEGAGGWGVNPAHTRWSLIVFIVVAADLAYAAWGLNPTVPAAFYDSQPNEGDGLARGYWHDEVEEQVKFTDFLPEDDYRIATERWEDFRASDLPNLNLLDRRYLLDNFDPLLFGAYDAYIRLIEADNANETLLASAGVAWRYGENGERIPLDAPSSRVWFARSVCWQDSEESLHAALPQMPPGTIHILGQGTCQNTAPEPLSPDALLLSDESSRVVVEIRAPYDGWLLLADTDYPGWTAAVDGNPVPIYRANLAFRAVQVPPGEHTITFQYHPRWLMPAVLVSVVSLVVTLLLFALKPPLANAER